MMNLLPTKAAAEYVNFSEIWLRKNYYAGNLPGQKIAGRLFFNRIDLDKFKENRPKPGPKPMENISEKVKLLKNKGLSHSEVAEKLGISISHVSRLAAKGE